MKDEYGIDLEQDKRVGREEPSRVEEELMQGQEGGPAVGSSRVRRSEQRKEVQRD